MKFRYFAVAGLAAAVSGCTTVHDYYPGSQVVGVDGSDYMVRKMSTSSGNSWMATANKPSGASLFVIDPSVYAGNVKAIEKATGCKVAAGSAQNTYNTTYAAVDCSAVAPASGNS
jgi:hypothetical protein